MLTSVVVEVLAGILGGIEAGEDIRRQDDTICTETSILSNKCQCLMSYARAIYGRLTSPGAFVGMGGIGPPGAVVVKIDVDV